MKSILCALAALGLAAGAAADTNRFQEGTHYERIGNPSSVEPDRVEVVEVFSYACPACAQFQPYIARWEEEIPEYVDFRRVPVVFQPSWEPFAQSYHTATVLGIVEDGHGDLFDALHSQRQRLRTLDDLAEFWSGYGVSTEEFMTTAGGFAVDTRMRQGRTEAGRWQVSGTPTVVVNGKWRIGGRLPGINTYDDFIEVIDYLVVMEAPADVAGEDAEPAEEETVVEQASDS